MIVQHHPVAGNVLKVPLTRSEWSGYENENFEICEFPQNLPNPLKNPLKCSKSTKKSGIFDYLCETGDELVLEEKKSKTGKVSEVYLIYLGK